MADIPQIFLSYAREDKEKVNALRRRLKAAGFKVWMDTSREKLSGTQNIKPGQEWDKVIYSAILGSDFFLACISKTYVTKKSRPIQRELRLALTLRKNKVPGAEFLIPVRLENHSLPPNLRRYQAVDYFLRGGFGELKRVLDAGMIERNSSKQGPDNTPFTIPGALVVPKHAERGVEVSIQLHRENMRTEVRLDKVKELGRMLGITVFPRSEGVLRKSNAEIHYEVLYKLLGIQLAQDHIFSSEGGFIARSPWPFDADVRLGRDLLDQMTLIVNSQDGSVTITPK